MNWYIWVIVILLVAAPFMGIYSLGRSKRKFFNRLLFNDSNNISLFLGKNGTGKNLLTSFLFQEYSKKVKKSSSSTLSKLNLPSKLSFYSNLLLKESELDGLNFLNYNSTFLEENKLSGLEIPKENSFIIISDVYLNILKLLKEGEDISKINMITFFPNLFDENIRINKTKILLTDRNINNIPVQILNQISTFVYIRDLRFKKSIIGKRISFDVYVSDLLLDIEKKYFNYNNIKLSEKKLRRGKKFFNYKDETFKFSFSYKKALKYERFLEKDEFENFINSYKNNNKSNEN